MTNLQMLALLSDLYDAQSRMTLWMYNAIEGGGDASYVWRCLFMWVEVKDERDELWKKIGDHYFNAVMLREGKKP